MNKACAATCGGLIQQPVNGALWLLMVQQHGPIMSQHGTQQSWHCGFMVVLMAWLAKISGDLIPPVPPGS